MSNSNHKTLETYEKNFQNYIDGTVQITTSDSFQGQWIASVLDRLPKSVNILEIGSAFGRDARFILEQGYLNLTLTDAFDTAVAYLNDNGFAARKFNVLTDELTSEYDLILASAVFLHFTADELRIAAGKLKEHIKLGGYLAFSVKLGDGEEWSDHKMGGPRYFRYWQEDELLNLLVEQGYEAIDVRSTSDGKWLHVTLKVSK